MRTLSMIISIFHILMICALTIYMTLISDEITINSLIIILAAIIINIIAALIWFESYIKTIKRQKRKKYIQTEYNKMIPNIPLSRIPNLRSNEGGMKTK